jgi:lysozyme
MSQGQIDAFTSFIFNTGCTRFRKNPDGSETRIFKHIRQGNYKNACNELRFWVYGAGKKLPGLVKRRQKEMELCFAN